MSSELERLQKMRDDAKGDDEAWERAQNNIDEYFLGSGKKKKGKKPKKQKVHIRDDDDWAY